MYRNDEVTLFFGGETQTIHWSNQNLTGNGTLLLHRVVYKRLILEHSLSIGY